jgi:hypothetical protein
MTSHDMQVRCTEPITKFIDDPEIVELRKQLLRARQGLSDAEQALKACEESLAVNINRAG